MVTIPNKINIGICGVGRFATRRVIPAIKRCENAELAAIVKNSLRETDTSGDVDKYHNLDDLILANKVDAVYISSPNIFHAEQTISCLKSGIHVLCEKPMATTFVDCQAMTKVAKEMNLTLQVGHMLRFSSAINVARLWLEEEMLSDILEMNIIFHYDLPEKNRSWVKNKKLSGGGVLLDAGIHCIDVLRYLLGNNVISGSAEMDKCFEDGMPETRAMLKYTYGDVVGSIDLSSTSAYRSYLEILGKKACITIENFAATWGTVDIILYNSDKSKILKKVKTDVSGTYLCQLDQFIRNIKTLNQGVIDYDASKNIKVAEYFYSHAKTY